MMSFHNLIVFKHFNVKNIFINIEFLNYDYDYIFILAELAVFPLKGLHILHNITADLIIIIIHI